MDSKKVFYVAIALMITSCSFNDEKYNQEILGTWDVYKATLNAKPTGLMKDAYFEFKTDKSVISNVLEGNQKLTFDIKNSVLSIDTDSPFEMNISKLEADTMLLDGKMSYYQMEYFLVKRK